MITVIASIQVKEGEVDAFMDIFKKNVPNVLKEKGCIEYYPTVDVSTDLPPQEIHKNGVTIVEKWDSLEDLKVHLSAPHMLAYRENAKNLVENTSIRILREA